MSPYPATVAEICRRFATSPERNGILHGYLKLREALFSRGITGFQWIDGSFLEEIEVTGGRPPGDIDVVTFVEVPHDAAALDAMLTGTMNLLDRDWVKSSFKVDHFIVPLCSHPRLVVSLTRYWFGLFSHRRDGLWKGMLEVPLQDITEHTVAKSFLQALVMSNQSFLKTQVIDLEHMLEEAKDDPVLGRQLEQRVRAARKTLQEETTDGTLFPPVTPELPRAAVFFRGGGVEGSVGIRPALAGEALIHYEKMFVEQALHDERVAARSAGRHRRQRGSAVPALLLTGTPRGSFGLEFTPQLQEDHALLDVHRGSLEHIAEALITAVESDSADQLAETIPAKVLQPLTRFFRTLANYQAELRLALPGGRSRTISSEQATATAERLERTIDQNEVERIGTFRGLTLESGHFDLVLEDGTVVTGIVADAFTEQDLERIDSLTNKRCRASLQETRITKAGRTTSSVILLDAKAI